jgi:hypothetical protein
MNIVVPSSMSQPWSEAVESVRRAAPLPPFSAEVLAFLGELSRSLLTHPETRRRPDLAALGYWLRPAALTKLRAQVPTKDSAVRWAPRGMALHFAPANVDTAFAYTWLLSMLVGNVNVVRLSSRSGESTLLLCQRLNALLERPEFQALREQVLVLSYEHDEAITATLCGLCQLRIIYGSDATVRTLRAVPIPAGAVDLIFPDRFSLAVLKSDAVLQLSSSELDGLAKRFLAETLSFDQAACSSARLVAWVGTAEATQLAKQRFWESTARVWTPSAESPLINGVRRLVGAQHAVAAMGATAAAAIVPGGPLHVDVPRLTEELRDAHPGAGLLFERSMSALPELVPELSDREQTLAHFGFDRSELDALLDAGGGRYLLRVVPIGESSQFDAVWDGYDLLASMSRVVRVRAS